MTIVAEIYDVAGRNEGHDVSSQDLVGKINRSTTTYATDLEGAESQLRDLVAPADVVLVMGAGDIDEVARKLV